MEKIELGDSVIARLLVISDQHALQEGKSILFILDYLARHSLGDVQQMFAGLDAFDAGPAYRRFVIDLDGTGGADKGIKHALASMILMYGNKQRSLNALGYTLMMICRNLKPAIVPAESFKHLKDDVLPCM